MVTEIFAEYGAKTLRRYEVFHAFPLLIFIWPSQKAFICILAVTTGLGTKYGHAIDRQ